MTVRRATNYQPRVSIRFLKSLITGKPKQSTGHGIKNRIIRISLDNLPQRSTERAEPVIDRFAGSRKLTISNHMKTGRCNEKNKNFKYSGTFFYTFLAYGPFFDLFSDENYCIVSRPPAGKQFTNRTHMVES